jgi:hypothetical protein
MQHADFTKQRQVVDFIESRPMPRKQAIFSDPLRSKRLRPFKASYAQSYPQTEWRISKAVQNHRLTGRLCRIF